MTLRTVGPASSGAAVLSNEFGFIFVAPWIVGPGQSLDSNITYVVTATGGNLIDDASLVMAGAAASGTGIATVAENLFDVALTENIGTMFAFAIDGTQSLVDHVTFAPRTSLLVVKDIALQGARRARHP